MSRYEDISYHAERAHELMSQIEIQHPDFWRSARNVEDAEDIEKTKAKLIQAAQGHALTAIAMALTFRP